MKASRKNVHDKVLIFWGQKPIFLPQNGGTITKNITLNMYIGINCLAYERLLIVKVYKTHMSLLLDCK